MNEDDGMTKTTKEELIRQKAEERRWRLLNKGQKRIQQLETGHTEKEHPIPKNKNALKKENNNTNESSIPDEYYIKDRVGVENRHDEHHWLSLKAYRYYALHFRSHFIIFAACLAVILSASWPYKSSKCFFFKLRQVSLTTFCISELLIELIIMTDDQRRPWYIIMFRAGILFPILQLLSMCLTLKEIMTFISLCLVVFGGYLSIKYPNKTFMEVFQWLLDCSFRHIGTIIHSFQSGRNYVLDFALFYVSLSISILILTSCIRTTLFNLINDIH